MEVNRLRPRSSGRRARVVCHRCHEKKIRCDLQRVGATCSACLNAGASCDFRPSHKGHHRKKTNHEIQQPLNHTAGSIVTEQSTPRLPASTSKGDNYIRALLGHQSKHHGASNDRDETAFPIETSDRLMIGANRSYLETHSETCYTWCPIIDVDETMVTTNSALLDQSLAAVASMIRPSLMPRVALPREYYEGARQLFFTDSRDSNLILVKAALLLSCCDNNGSETPIDSSFWWLGVAIRLAQDMRLYRVPRHGNSTHDVRLQRRIWWTLFARERVLALCQGRPCIIDENDCNLGLPQATDFPESRYREARIFVCWVNLCGIMGEVSKHMSIARQTGRKIPTQEIADSLTTWLRSLPNDLQLPIQGICTTVFVRDIHVLHLPYFTTIALMYLNTTGQDAPEVSVAAVLAAACTARVIGDVLLRGCVNALPEDSGWFIAIAITALMHVRPLMSFATHAAADICILRTALGHMGAIWSSAKTLAAGLDRIMDDHQTSTTTHYEHEEDLMSPSSASRANTLFTAGAQSLQDLCAGDGVPWSDFFPFTTTQTSPLVKAILTECQDSHLEIWPEFNFDEYFGVLWNETLPNETNLL